ncbi:hypothetical protein IS717_004881, partial [Escherichia coli]|nr:hypothetical protein [Escherichia coli]HCS6276964.1 hypothetical protein [Escherichia coli]HCS6446192.1 hypothetical protein [Escherichia coli]
DDKFITTDYLQQCLLSPGTAVLLGWLFLDQTLSALQIIGVLLVIGSIWLGQRSNRTPRARIACRKSP